MDNLDLDLDLGLDLEEATDADLDDLAAIREFGL